MRKWLTWILGEERPTPPVMLRVANCQGVPVDNVRLIATWYPCGTRVDKQQRTAQGLCILTWRKDAKRVAIEVTADGLGQEHVELCRSHGGRALSLQLS